MLHTFPFKLALAKRPVVPPLGLMVGHHLYPPGDLFGRASGAAKVSVTMAVGR